MNGVDFIKKALGNTWLQRIGIALLFTMLPGLLHDPAVRDRIDFDTIAVDMMFNAQDALDLKTSPSEVFIVAMDEPSYEVLGIPMSAPWPRGTHAKLLRKLADLGATRAVFDVLFLGEGADPAQDEELAQAFAIMPSVIGTQYTELPYETPMGTLISEELEEPYEKFLQVVENTGLVGYDLDGEVIRNFHYKHSDSLGELMSIDLAAAQGLTTHQDLPDKHDFIRYYGPPGTVPTYSYYQLIDPEASFPKEKVEGKVAVIALRLRTGTGPMAKDDFATPYYSTRMYGGEVHASAIANLLRHDWIDRLEPGIEVSIEQAANALGVLAIFSFGPLISIGLVLLVIISWLIASFWYFSANLFIPGAGSVLFALPAAALIHVFHSYYRSRKEQKRLREEQEKIQKAFASYVPPQMATELAKEGYNLELGGKKVLASAMFTDIASFTSISESLTPEAVAEMLNAYFTEMGHVIFDNNGTLIKFIGDAVFVIWGAPIDMIDHADRALATAMEANERLKTFNAQKRFPHLHTRIGVHSGYMVAGNLGTNWRFDYTAIGDAVNLSARVEGINKYLGTSVLVTQDTKNLLTRPADLMAMGSVQVVGKEIAVELYTPAWIGLTDEARTLWGEALSSFRSRDWDTAQKQFEHVVVLSPELKKGASQYLHDIEAYLITPPGENWQGELVFSSK